MCLLMKYNHKIYFSLFSYDFCNTEASRLNFKLNRIFLLIIFLPKAVAEIVRDQTRE